MIRYCLHRRAWNIFLVILTVLLVSVNVRRQRCVDQPFPSEARAIANAVMFSKQFITDQPVVVEKTELHPTFGIDLLLTTQAKDLPSSEFCLLKEHSGLDSFLWIIKLVQNDRGQFDILTNISGNVIGYDTTGLNKSNRLSSTSDLNDIEKSIQSTGLFQGKTFELAPVGDKNEGAAAKKNLIFQGPNISNKSLVRHNIEVTWNDGKITKALPYFLVSDELLKRVAKKVGFTESRRHFCIGVLFSLLALGFLFSISKLKTDWMQIVWNAAMLLLILCPLEILNKFFSDDLENGHFLSKLLSICAIALTLAFINRTIIYGRSQENKQSYNTMNVLFWTTCLLAYFVVVEYGLRNVLGYELPPLPISFFSASYTSHPILFIPVQILSAVVVEELVFRQTLIEIFRLFLNERINPRGILIGVLIQAILFASLHSLIQTDPMWLTFLEFAPIGFFLGMLYLRFGLVFSITVHFLVDLLLTSSSYIALTGTSNMLEKIFLGVCLFVPFLILHMARTDKKGKFINYLSLYRI